MNRGNGRRVGGIGSAAYPGEAAGQLPPSRLPSAPPAPPEEPAATRPSDGWISSQPWPENESWIVSPEPLPISVFRFTSVFTELVTPSDQVIAACGSANVSVPSRSSITG